MALREWRTGTAGSLTRHSLARVAALMGMGAALGCMGPFGTSEALEAKARFAYWILVVPLVGLPATAVFRFVFLGPVLAAKPWSTKFVVATLAASAPGAVIVHALNPVFGLSAPGSGSGIVLEYGWVALLTAVVGLWAMALTERDLLGPLLQAAPVETPPAPQALTRRAGASPFLERLPARLGRRLLHIETEDHYLRVHTDWGHDLVLFRFADALAEIDETLGLQVHRSHWVARQAVERVERDGHRTTLRLTSGACIPVSRTFLPALRRAGWL